MGHGLSSKAHFQGLVSELLVDTPGFFVAIGILIVNRKGLAHSGVIGHALPELFQQEPQSQQIPLGLGQLCRPSKGSQTVIATVAEKMHGTLGIASHLVSGKGTTDVQDHLQVPETLLVIPLPDIF
jgi:hypothetical protein